MSRWWRAYDEALHDPKLQRLPPALFKAWFNLMCIASKNAGILPSIGDIAYELHMNESAAAVAIAGLAAKGLIDKRDDGRFEPHNWPSRQFQSDVSTERVKRFREQRRNVSLAVSETPPETEAETDTESSSLRSEATQRKRGSRLPADWQPSEPNHAYATAKGMRPEQIAIQAEKFRNYWTAKSGQTASKNDWDAVWRNWILTATEQAGAPNGQRNYRAKPSAGADFFAGIAEVARDLNGHDPVAREAADEVPLGRFNIDG